MKVKVRIGKTKMINIIKTEGFDRAFRIIRHEHTNYDNLLKSNNWDQVRRALSVELAKVLEGNAQVAAKIYINMKATSKIV